MLSDLLSECFAADFKECWERERTATLARHEASRSHTRNLRFLGTPVRAFAIRLHATGYSLRETEAILLSLDVERSHQAIWQWVYRLADSVPDPPSSPRAKLS